ncbi:hypothetical protein OHD62_23600 [Mesorhizobium sp. YC-39]|uniref:hypothetical protein n=1 Tax=unclassified Mesorhizobium TaxID=325217 RepID=UPI0021E72921|nr:MULTISPECIES: hypothetical protein [unclassified Mesorhizobium]MCV3209281.1 hypothetical protein [Mesorhizobium sp. YC-2]MCV3231369.1 hypothetical protein [Mesorhizobium sp. YC-39]
MSYNIPVLAHVAIGSAAILFYWVTLLSVKGSKRHRAWGRAFFSMLMLVALSVGPLLLLGPDAFDPAFVVQFVYLDLCLITVAMLGWTAIRWKDDVDRFRGWHFKALAFAILVLGMIVLISGIASGTLLTVIFSWIGLVYGGAMLRFAWMRAEPHPRWWLGWHLNAVCGLFNAVHGTFLAVAWEWLAGAQTGDEVSVVMQLATIAAAVAMRVWFGHRRSVPMRFSRPSPSAAADAGYQYR